MKGKAMTTQTEFFKDTIKQAGDSFNKALETGVKFQEQTARFWTDLANRNMDELRGRLDKYNTDAMPFSRKNLDSFHRIFDTQVNKGLDLLKQTVETAKSQSAGEMYDQMLSFWRNSFDAMRETADAVAKVNNEMFDAWTGMFHVGNGGSKPGPSKPAAKPQA